MDETQTLKMTARAALMAALIAVGAFLAVPIGPVPIVLQNLFVLLAGLLLGPRWGVASVGAYLLAGFAGLPVFAGGAGGIGRLAGPTGGYLIGFPLAAFLAGWVSRRLSAWPASSGGRRQTMADAAGCVLGGLVIYAAGVPWLMAITGMDAARGLAVGMLPFLPGDAVKIVAAVALARSLRPLMPAFDENGAGAATEAGSGA